MADSTSSFTMDSHDYHNSPAVFDGATTLAEESSDGDTMTTFSQIIHHMPLEQSEHSRGNASVFLMEAQTFCGKAKDNVGECMVDTSADVKASMKTAGKYAKEYYDDFQTEEKRKAREQTAKEVMDNVKSCMVYCREHLISLCLQMLDHPMQEVEVRDDGLEPNESLTFDQMMTDAETTARSDDRYMRRSSRGGRSKTRRHKHQNGIYLVPTEEEPFTSRSETDTEGRDEPGSGTSSQSKERASYSNTDTQRDGAFPAIRPVDSDGSILRFKEALYRHIGGKDERQSPPQVRYTHEVSSKSLEKPSVLEDERQSVPQARYTHDVSTKPLNTPSVLEGKSHSVLQAREDTQETSTTVEKPTVLDDERLSVPQVRYTQETSTMVEKPTGLKDEHRSVTQVRYTHEISTTLEKPTAFDTSGTSDNERKRGDLIDLSNEPIGLARLRDASVDNYNVSAQPIEIYDATSMPSFAEEHETIDCSSWIEENVNDELYAVGYDGNVGAFSQPIDLTMYE